MSNTIKKLRIFVASASDVAIERAAIETVAISLKPMADYLGLTLEVVDWRQVVSDVGRPQQIIFNQINPNSWDIFVGILWHRLGTPPGNADPITGTDYLSGTEEEFRMAFQIRAEFGHPRIVVYRCMRAFPNDVDLLQLQHLRDFIKEIEDPLGKNPVLIQSFDSVESLERLWHHDLQKLLTEYAESSPIAMASTKLWQGIKLVLELSSLLVINDKNPGDIYKELINNFIKKMNFKSGQILLVKGEELVIAASSNERDINQIVGKNSVCGHHIFTLKKTTPVIIRDILKSDYKKYYQWFLGNNSGDVFPMRSEFVVPLNKDDKTIGVVNIEDPKEDAFSDLDEQIVEIFGKMIEIPIDRIESEKKDKNLLYAAKKFFDPYVFDVFSKNPDSLKRMNKNVTIVFWDIRYFSRLSNIIKLNPRLSLTGFIDEFFSKASEVIHKHKGVLDKFIGDGIMAIFGVFDEDTEAHVMQNAARAVEAAHDLNIEFNDIHSRWIRLWNDNEPRKINIGLGCGIHTGDAIVGLSEMKTRDHYTAIGHHVNIASRITQAAKIGKIYVSQTTKNKLYQLDKSKYTFTLIDPPLEFKNIDGEFDVYDIVDCSKQ